MCILWYNSCFIIINIIFIFIISDISMRNIVLSLTLVLFGQSSFGAENSGKAPTTPKSNKGLSRATKRILELSSDEEIVYQQNIKDVQTHLLLVGKYSKLRLSTKDSVSDMDRQEEELAAEEKQVQQNRFGVKFFITGVQAVGKSTLINTYLGLESSSKTQGVEYHSKVIEDGLRVKICELAGESYHKDGLRLAYGRDADVIVLVYDASCSLADFDAVINSHRLSSPKAKIVLVDNCYKDSDSSVTETMCKDFALVKEIDFFKINASMTSDVARIFAVCIDEVVEKNSILDIDTGISYLLGDGLGDQRLDTFCSS
jgi:GTPase SAR1 family protein